MGQVGSPFVFTDGGKKTAEAAMEYDRRYFYASNFSHLNGSLQEKRLHLYQWQGAGITYGHFSKPQTLLSLDAFEKNGFFAVQRPTGGGILFHEGDLGIGFSFGKRLWQNLQPLEKAYGLIHTTIQEAVKEACGLILEITEENGGAMPSAPFPFEIPLARTSGAFCQASPVRGDGFFQGAKVLGGALRVGKERALYQGSLQLFPSPTLFPASSHRMSLFPKESKEILEKIKKSLSQRFQLL